MKTFFAKHSRKSGSLLVEVIIATALFAITILSMVIVLYPFLFGSQEATFQPHLNRLQMEALERMLDSDYSAYAPVFAFEGELRDSSNRWVNPGPITLSQGTWAEVKDVATFQARALIDDQPLTVATNTSDPAALAAINTRQNYTLLFFGPETDWDTNGRQIVYIDVLYRIVVSNAPNKDQTAVAAISYETERVQRAANQTNQVVVGPSHHVVFTAEGYRMDDPNQDQALPYFKSEPNDLIEALFPNPFSQSVKRQTLQRKPGEFSTEQVYFPSLSLRYRMHSKGPQCIPTSALP